MSSIHKKLISNASKHIGVHLGTADGERVIAAWLSKFDLPLMSADGIYTPYCAAFIISCLADTADNMVFKSPSALTIWHKTPMALRRRNPIEGCLFVWDFGKGAGHIGIVTEVQANSRMLTIEGNTTIHAGDGEGQRLGGYVAVKNRSSRIGQIGKIRLLGFIDPFTKA